MAEASHVPTVDINPSQYASKSGEHCLAINLSKIVLLSKDNSHHLAVYVHQVRIVRHVTYLVTRHGIVLSALNSRAILLGDTVLLGGGLSVCLEA